MPGSGMILGKLLTGGQEDDPLPAPAGHMLDTVGAVAHPPLP